MAKRSYEEAKGRATKGTQKAKEPTVQEFVSFHPTEAQKDAITSLPWGALEALDYLAERAQSGLNWSVTSTQSGDALCLVCRSKSAKYGEGQALSFFHSHAHRLVVMAAYALQEVYPDWPEEPITSWQQRIDW